MYKKKCVNECLPMTLAAADDDDGSEEKLSLPSPGSALLSRGKLFPPTFAGCCFGMHKPKPFPGLALRAVQSVALFAAAVASTHNLVGLSTRGGPGTAGRGDAAWSYPIRSEGTVFLLTFPPRAEATSGSGAFRTVFGTARTRITLEKREIIILPQFY